MELDDSAFLEGILLNGPFSISCSQPEAGVLRLQVDGSGDSVAPPGLNLTLEVSCGDVCVQLEQVVIGVPIDYPLSTSRDEELIDIELYSGELVLDRIVWSVLSREALATYKVQLRAIQLEGQAIVAMRGLQFSAAIESLEKAVACYDDAGHQEIALQAVETGLAFFRRHRQEGAVSRLASLLTSLTGPLSATVPQVTEGTSVESIGDGHLGGRVSLGLGIEGGLPVRGTVVWTIKRIASHLVSGLIDDLFLLEAEGLPDNQCTLVQRTLRSMSAELGGLPRDRSPHDEGSEVASAFSRLHADVGILADLYTQWNSHSGAGAPLLRRESLRRMRARRHKFVKRLTRSLGRLSGDLEIDSLQRIYQRFVTLSESSPGHFRRLRSGLRRIERVVSAISTN